MTRNGTNKAVGYGMPLGDFLLNTKLPISRGNFYDQLSNSLMGTSNLVWCKQDITDAEGLFDLFAIVRHNAGDHIMMFPTLDYKTTWYRRHDAVDFVSAKMTPLRGAVYLGYPEYYPFLYHMDRNGVETSPPISWSDPALIPGIPPVMRWWLTRYGILDLTGIAKLRPLLGEWWGT